MEHPEGQDKHLLDGQEFVGFRLDCDQALWSFDAKHCRHFTLDWEGSRVMLVAFTVGHLAGLSNADQQELTSLGFSLPVKTYSMVQSSFLFATPTMTSVAAMQALQPILLLAFLWCPQPRTETSQGKGRS